MTEELRPIPGFTGLYSITRDGRIWSHPKHPGVGLQGRVHSGMWLATYVSRGREFVRLSNDGVKRTCSVRALVRKSWGAQ